MQCIYFVTFSFFPILHLLKDNALGFKEQRDKVKKQQLKNSVHDIDHLVVEINLRRYTYWDSKTKSD